MWYKSCKADLFNKFHNTRIKGNTIKLEWETDLKHVKVPNTEITNILQLGATDSCGGKLHQQHHKNGGNVMEKEARSRPSGRASEQKVWHFLPLSNTNI